MTESQRLDMHGKVVDLARYALNLDVAFTWFPNQDRLGFWKETVAGREFVVVDANTGEVSLNETPLADAQIGDARSPDGTRMIEVKDHDLWIAETGTGKKRRITWDGVPGFSYGSVDVKPYFDQQLVRRRRHGHTSSPEGVMWSPSGRFVAAVRLDLRRLAERTFVTEYVPSDREYSYTHLLRVPIASDGELPDKNLVIYDTECGKLCHVNLPPQALNDYALLYAVDGVFWWRESSLQLFLITANRGGSRCGLTAVDLTSGRIREILQESGQFNVRLNPYDYHRPNVHITEDAQEFIWYSERTGYGHLYLHDAITGSLKHQITSGEWVVFDLLRVDELERRVYFTAATRTRGENPYYRYLYRVSLDGGEPELLTPEPADHRFHNYFGPFRYLAGGVGSGQPGSSISPSGRYFVDNYSTVEEPPAYVLRRCTGDLVSRLLSCDASRLRALGWRPPERFVVKAADGVTDLYGTITRPRHFDPHAAYPVIDSMYPGPQGSWAPRAFIDVLVGGSIHNLQNFADAGFIVVALDGRGTAHRPRAFRDAFLGTEDVFGAADHVAAIKQLAAGRLYMDLKRVGVRGQSFGGYGALRAMLLFPDVFKVAVAATGPEGYLDFPSGVSVERFFGDPAASPAARTFYELIDNCRLAPRLVGRVLLIYGCIDENVPLRHGMALIQAFVRAGKHVDMVLMPDGAHSTPRDPYVVARSVQYFIDHLAGART